MAQRTFKAGRVIRCPPDEDNVTWTIEGDMRDGYKMDNKKDYIHKETKAIRTADQRLALLIPQDPQTPDRTPGGR